MKNKRNIILCAIMTFITIIYTILVKFVDVKKIGPKNSSVGFASLNGWFNDLVGSNMTIYKITEILGYLIFILCAFYGIIGIYQLIKRKNIKKVDKEIILVGLFYVLVLAVYVIFEKVVINYRPVLIDGELEASFPSSHTMLSLCVGISSLLISKKYINIKYIGIVNLVTIILMLSVLLGRLISGVHWLSDIIGGIIISITLILYFVTAHNYIKHTKKELN